MLVKRHPENPSDVENYRRLLGYVTPYWQAFLLSIFGFILYSVSNVGFLQLIAYIVDSLAGHDPLAETQLSSYLRSFLGEQQTLNRAIIPIAIVMVVFSRGIGTFIGNYFIIYVGTNLVHNLRVELFNRLLLLPSRFYDKNAMGHLVSKVTFHVSQVTDAATDAVRVIIRESFTIFGYLSYLFYLNWKLTFIFLVVAPFIIFLVNYAGKRFRRISERIQNSMGDVTHVASEAVQGYREVRAFGGTDYERERFEKVSHDNRRQSMKMVVTASIATPAVQLIVAVALAVLVWLVLDPVLLANMSSGDVVAFIATGGLLAKPIRQLSDINSTIQRGLAAAEDIFSIFDEPAESDEGSHALSKVQGKIEFRDVSFAYADSDESVLKHISFTALPGETIALVGRSGSGKSTLASLIPRFHSPQAGAIYLDDIPIAEIKLENLRQHIAIVSQDSTLFNDTVGSNIAYGALRDSSRRDIQFAAERAYAWDFIQQLAQGLDTIVGDDGVLLSGGQRQRLAIARAFLKDAPILILDEATSALDSESEKFIKSALNRVAKGRTTIVIAHRLSTIERADRILVLDNGEIVERGTHGELLANSKHYAGLHNLQVSSSAIQTTRTCMTNTSSIPLTAPSIHNNNRVRLSDKLSALVVDRFLMGWYTKHSIVKLLTPLAWAFTQITQIRRRYIIPWKASVPVIVIGNISIGGTGKTPLVAWLASMLKAQGYMPGIVTRGYGGHYKNYPLEVASDTDPLQAGDEAVMLARKVSCPVVADPDRCQAASNLIDKYQCNIIVADDGLQHYKLERDVEIAVVDGKRGLGNGLCFPAGPLREPPVRLQEVDLIIVNGQGSVELPYAYVKMAIQPTALIHLMTAERLNGDLNSNKIHGVTGIGHPERFFDSLRAIGLEVIEHRFTDHHWFRLADLIFKDSLPVVMTEKDAVKCRLLNPSLIHDNFWYLEINVDIAANFLSTVLAKLD